MTKEEEKKEVLTKIRDLQKYFESTELSYSWNGYLALMLKKIGDIVAPARNSSITPNQLISEWMELMAFAEMECGIIYHGRCEYSEEDSRALYNLCKYIREHSSDYFRKKLSKNSKKVEKR